MAPLNMMNEKHVEKLFAGMAGRVGIKLQSKQQSDSPPVPAQRLAVSEAIAAPARASGRRVSIARTSLCLSVFFLLYRLVYVVSWSRRSLEVAMSSGRIKKSLIVANLDGHDDLDLAWTTAAPAESQRVGCWSKASKSQQVEQRTEKKATVETLPLCHEHEAHVDLSKVNMTKRQNNTVETRRWPRDRGKTKVTTEALL